jgi:hypothetical protein
MIQQACVRKLCRGQDRGDDSTGRDPRDRPGTPRRHPEPLGMARPTLNKPRPQSDRLRPDGAMVTYLCNLLDENDEKPWRVLKAAGLAPKTQADWYTPDAVLALYSAAHRHMPPALDDSTEASASDAQSEDSGKTGAPCVKVPGSSRFPVRDEQTHPHRPRLVVSHSTCPPLSSSPPANRL